MYPHRAVRVVQLLVVEFAKSGFARSQGDAARSMTGCVNPAVIIGHLRFKTFGGEKNQFLIRLVEKLNRSRVAAGDFDCRRQNLVVNGLRVFFGDEPRRQALQNLRSAQIFGDGFFRLLALGRVVESDDRTLNAVVSGAIRQHAHRENAVVGRADFAFDRLERRQNRFRIVEQPVLAEPVRDVRERATEIGGNQVENLTRRRREQLHAEIAVEENRADVGRVDKVLQIVARQRDFFDIDFQFLVDRLQFFVDRLQFLFARLQFFPGRAQLFVERLQFFVRGAEFFGLNFVLLGGVAKLRFDPNQFFFELLRGGRGNADRGF